MNITNKSATTIFAKQFYESHKVVKAAVALKLSQLLTKNKYIIWLDESSFQNVSNAATGWSKANTPA